jgi:hypothetical protein
MGRTSEGESIITKGLQAGEQVVREGQFLLGPGARVEIKDSGKPAESKEAKGEGMSKGDKGRVQKGGDS